jgi:pimeloyl-ACP methyl ester carboxylesterase
LATMLALPERVGPPDYQILRWARTRGYSTRAFATYVIETEPGIPVVAVRLNDASLLSRIPQGPKRAVLYIAHASADVEMREDAWLREICRENADAAIFACDLRGVGDSKPLVSTPENPSKGGADYFHAGCGLLFNYPTVGQRAHDVLRVLDLLRETGHEEIHLVARGWGAIPAAFAAVVHDRVTRVTLKQALTSYSDIAESETYRWPLSALVPGILPVFDLPDCYRELQNKGLTLIEPVSAEGVPR